MIELDWQAYFRDFCSRHGKPVEIGGRLIFPDGWSYSATDHAGPEWPPPANENERRALQLRCWEMKRAELKAALMDAAQDLKDCKTLQSVKEGDLRQVGEDGKVSRVDFQGLLLRQQALRREVRKAEAEIERLRTGGEHAKAS